MKLTTAASVLAAAISMAAGAPAFASSLCTNTTNCTLTLNDSNVNGSGNYGTVNLQYDGSYGGYGEITITVNLAGTLGVDNPDNTYPGDFGFTDSLGTGGSLYIDDFNGDDPNHNYSGFTTGSEHDFVVVRLPDIAHRSFARLFESVRMFLVIERCLRGADRAQPLRTGGGCSADNIQIAIAPV